MFQPSFRGMQLQKAQSQKRERSESFTAGSNIPDIRFQVPSSNFASHCVSRTLNTSPSRLVANCPHKCSSNQSHRLLLCTRFFSSQGITRGLWPFLLLSPEDSLCPQCSSTPRQTGFSASILNVVLRTEEKWSAFEGPNHSSECFFQCNCRAVMSGPELIEHLARRVAGPGSTVQTVHLCLPHDQKLI